MTKQPLDHLRSRKQPVTRTVRLVSDISAAEELDDARQNLRSLNIMAAGRTDEPYLQEMASAKTRVAEAELAVKNCTTTWKFKAMGSKAFNQLKKDHPPTDKNREDMKADGGDPDSVQFNTDTFPAAIISATLVDPVLTPEEVQAMMDEDLLNEGEMLELFNAAMTVNLQRRIGDMGNF